MTSSPATANANVLCNAAAELRSACFGEPSYKDAAGESYCLFHFPSTEKSREFRAALNERLEKENYDFRGVWFPFELELSRHSFATNAVFRSATFAEQADFSRTNFGARADFTDAVFAEQARFNSANFIARANFDGVRFQGNANFDRANFRARAGFNSARFSEKASFESATFHERTNFGEARFKGKINFRLTNFKDYVRFAGTKENRVFLDRSRLDLREVKIDKPELVSFNTLTLHPHWFVDVNASKFDFSNVEWKGCALAEEIAEIERIAAQEETYKSMLPARYTLFGIACWNLAVNAEENHRYEEASNFRYMAMEAQRRESPGLLLWLYWAVSGYGEKVIRALLVLLGILVVFACLYAAAARNDASAGLRVLRALRYSASVMTLQKPEPPPTAIAVQGLVILETVMGPVQAALLALAIRRKFMR